MSNMRRLGIFSFYDREGRVGSYIDYLLRDWSRVLERLIVVVNGELDENGIPLFEKYTKEIVIRDNKGFDAGAYADVIVNYLSREEIELYDELILCNDTFYGPFTSFEKIFMKMEIENKDFWGLNYVNRGFLSHIQSYFLVFGRKLLASKEFWNFIQSINIQETELKNVYGEFETKAYCCFKNKFSIGSYVDTQLLDVYESGISCILLYGLPILKKKTFDTRYNSIEKQKGILKLLSKKTDYPLKYILENIDRNENIVFTKYEIENADEIKADELKYLCNLGMSKDEIYEWIGMDPFYIYGAGVISREIYKSIFVGNENMKGFIVSDKQKNEENGVFGYPIIKRTDAYKNEKIIVGMNKLLSDEIRKNLSDENVLFIWANERKTYVGR